MESFRHIGEGDHGNRSTVIFKGGRFNGPKLRGTILPGGGNWETIQDHDGDQQTAYLDTRHNLLTHGRLCIFLKTTGTRTGKESILEGLGEEDKHTPNECKMRDERYKQLNSIFAIPSSARNGTRIIYDAYHVL